MITPMTECLICYGETTKPNNCSNGKCTFSMCSECIRKLKGPECPSCKQIIHSYPKANTILRGHAIGPPPSRSVQFCRECLDLNLMCYASCIFGLGFVYASKGVGWLALKLCCAPKG